MKKSVCFIVNPISGVGRQKVIEKLVAEKLDKSRFEHRIVYTAGPKHAIELSRQCADNGCDIVVAVGGDGSVNEAGRGLIGTNTALAIIPAGSGNGLARHLHIPVNLVKAIEVINHGNEISMDTVRMNGERFLGMAGIGFDAHIGWEFAKFGKRGFYSYIKVVMREYPKYKAQQYELEIDGKKYERHSFLISFANGSQYGNNAAICPGANLQDGLLDICILREFPLYAIPMLAYRLFNKKMHESKYIEIIRGKKVVVKQPATTAHIDGEPVEIGNVIDIEVDPLSLKVISPNC
jgi:diacylglycerol kinase (ATP)